MVLEYISHSCFVIESEGLRIAFDPWITGSAYANQWHLFPKPVNTGSVEKADVLLISHGHEDHLHQESLKKINKSAHVFFPFQWREGIKNYLEGMDFNLVTEAVSFKTYSVKNFKITFLGYSLESVVVVECENYVIVNINDALNSNHETAVTFLLEKIRERWKKIDFLLSGWSGAGFFPNKVHFKNKDDIEIARTREQYFADNFCRFTSYLKPGIAIPFAPGFVLLSESNRWINDIKFPRHFIPDYYSQNFESGSGIFFPVMYPGDYFKEKEFHKVSIYHDRKSDHDIYRDVAIDFASEIEEVNKIEILSEKELNVLVDKLEYRINENRKIYPVEVILDAVFSIRLTDCEENNFLNVYCEDGIIKVERNNSAGLNDRLIITVKGKLLSRNLDKMWGGDLLSIGYGIDVEIFDAYSLEKNLDIVCVRLISRYPVFKDDVLKHSKRVLKYYFTNPSPTSLWIKQKVKLRPYVNKYPFNERDHWITYSKCDLCQVCKMPELDFEKIL